MDAAGVLSRTCGSCHIIAVCFQSELTSTKTKQFLVEYLFIQFKSLIGQIVILPISDLIFNKQSLKETIGKINPEQYVYCVFSLHYLVVFMIL